MKLFLSAISLSLFCVSASAQTIERNYIYDVDVVSVYDGDTLTVDIDLGFSIWKKGEVLRLYGLDAPEVRGPSRPRGLESRDWLRQKITEGEQFIIQSIKDDQDKYGRYLAVLYIDGVNINQLMVEQGLAVPYLP